MSADWQKRIAAFKNYYSILGIPPTATTKEVSKAFRKLVHKWHPDRHDEFRKFFANCKFLEIKEAYNTLKDPKKRREYDIQWGHIPKPVADYDNPGIRNRYRENNSSTNQQKPQSAPPPNKTEKVTENRTRKKGFFSKFSKVFSKKKELSNEEKTEISIKTYERNVALDPYDGNSHHKLATIYHRINDSEKAVKHYLIAIKLINDDADLFCNLGRLREEQGDYQRAINCYLKATKIQPRYDHLFVHLGSIYIKINSNQKVKTIINHLKKIGRYDLAYKLDKKLTNI